MVRIKATAPSAGQGPTEEASPPPKASRLPRFTPGIAHTKGDFFQEVPALNPDPRAVRELWNDYAGLGVLISSMECAPLFIKARHLGELTGERIEIGSILVSAGRCGGDELYAGDEASRCAVLGGERAAVETALGALSSLYRKGV